MLTKRITALASGRSSSGGGATHERVDSPPERGSEPGLYDDGRALGGSLFTPSDVGRGDRRHQTRQARAIVLAQRKAWMERRRDEIEAIKTERRSAAYLPVGGEKGASALRSYRKLKVQPHKATSDVLAGAYPYLAEAGLGTDGVLIGSDSWSGAAFVYDPWILYEHGVLTNPNQLLAGVIGKGKSMLAKSLATRSIAFGRKVYVAGDPKGEWSVVSRAVGGQAIELGGALTTRLNPLDEGPRVAGTDDETWRVETAQRRRALLGSLTESALGRPLASTEHTALDAALEVAVAGSDTPVLPTVVDALFAPTERRLGSSVGQLRADGRDAGHALSRLVHGDLGGLFDGPSTVRFDPNLPMVSLDLAHLGLEPTHRARHELCVGVDGSGVGRSPSGTALRDL